MQLGMPQFLPALFRLLMYGNRRKTLSASTDTPKSVIMDMLRTQKNGFKAA